MFFLRAAYFLSRDIEKNGQDLIRVAIGRRNPYQLKHHRQISAGLILQKCINFGSHTLSLLVVPGAVTGMQGISGRRRQAHLIERVLAVFS